MKNITFLLLAIFLSLSSLMAQNSGNFWFFGGGSLNWCTPQSNGDPLYLQGSMGGSEGFAIQTDANCNIIFYTDGTSVWNANHMQMTNSLISSVGGSLNGDPSSTQGALIVPHPTNSDIYYIFTVDANMGVDGLCYSKVDMTLNAGLGNIDLTEKNIQLITPATEKLNAVRHSNGTDIWVVAHSVSSANFVAYQITSAGVNVTTPVISTVGSVITTLSANTRGCLKFSQDGSRMAVAIEGMDRYELFDFNRSTGAITNCIALTGTSYGDCYGVEFSPSGQFLYGSERWGNELRQWDISLATASAVQSSEVVVGTMSSNIGGALQLGPDYKIYVARSNQSYIGRINSPDLSGTTCSYNDQAIYLGTLYTCGTSWPNFGVLNPYSQTSLTVSATTTGINICGNDSLVTLTASVTGGTSPYTYTWSTGETSSSIQNLPAGTYSLTVNDSGNGMGWLTTVVAGPDPFLVSPAVSHIDTVTGTLGSISLSISGGTPPYLYNWSNGSANSIISGLNSGLYACTVTDSNGCTLNLDYNIGYFSASTPLLVSETIVDNLCHGDSLGSIDLTISGGVSPYSLSWSNQATTSSINNLGTGYYSVTVSDANVSPISTTVPWSYTNTPYIHTIVIPANSIFIDGNPIVYGDYIGVFYNDNGIMKCAGYAMNLGNSISLYVRGDNPSTTIKEGFSIGETFSFKVWNHQTGEQSILTAAYDGSYQNTENFQDYGSSGITSLSGISGNDFGIQYTAGYYVMSPSPIIAWGTLSDYGGYNTSTPTATDGWISLNTVGGASPYSYLWSNSDTTSNPQNLAAGTYQVTITDANLCNATFSYTLTASPTTFTLSSTMANESCQGSCDGYINTSINGGVPPYNYTWSNGSSTSSISNLCPGTYTLTVTDAQTTITPSLPWNWANTGINHTIIFTSSTLQQLNIQSGDTLAVFYSDNGIYKCGGKTVFNTGVTAMTAWGDDTSTPDKDGFSAGETFTWAVHHVASGAISILSPTYSTSVPNSDTYATNGMSMVDQFIIASQSQIITYDILPGSAIQLNATVTPINPNTGTLGSISLSVTGGAAPYMYNWNNGALTHYLYNLIAGQYAITVTDMNGCMVSDTFTIDTLTITTPPWNMNFSGLSHSIVIPATALLEINGTAISSYDYIGVFYDDNGTPTCGGYALWNGAATTVDAYADNPATTPKEGFSQGEQFVWKFWDSSEGTEHPAVASYNSTYPQQEFFTPTGTSALDTLQTIGISGQVSSTTKSLLPAGMMLLYEQTPDGLVAIEKAPIADGDYLFEGLEKGDYLLYALPKPSQSFGIPAYHGNDVAWQNGSWITVSGHSAEVNLELEPIAPYNTGSANITGTILQGTDNTYNPDVFDDEWFPTKAAGDPARNISILLFDQQMNPMDFRLSNQQGTFSFEQMEFGSYFIKVEKAGLHADSVLVVLDASNSNANLDFVLNQGQILSSETVVENIDLQIFPNPVSGSLKIQSACKIESIELFSLTGQKLNIDKQANIENTIVDFSGIPTGVYVLQIEVGGRMVIEKITKL